MSITKPRLIDNIYQSVLLYKLAKKNNKKTVRYTSIHKNRRKDKNTKKLGLAFFTDHQTQKQLVN